VPDLLAMIDADLARRRQALDVQVPLDDGETLAWLYRRGEVLARRDGEAEAHITVLLDAADTARLEKRGFALSRAAE
jgi:GTP-binding protein HflX